MVRTLSEEKHVVGTLLANDSEEICDELQEESKLSPPIKQDFHYSLQLSPIHMPSPITKKKSQKPIETLSDPDLDIFVKSFITIIYFKKPFCVLFVFTIF